MTLTPGTAVTPGTCLLHGYHGMTSCPTCSTAVAVPLNRVTPPPPTNDLQWLWQAGYDAGYAAALRERDLTPKEAAA